MGTFKMSDKSIARHFGFLRNLDSESKEKLIRQLTDSMVSKSSANKNIDQLFGAWDDTTTADEMIKKIRESRTQSLEIEGFE